MVILIQPYGEFPINDDWVYSLPVRWWLETGRLHLIFWQGVSLLSQVALATAWSALVGFSLMHLRILVIVLTFIFLGAAYALSREAGLARSTSFVIVLTFLAFPIFPALATSFMTDVPFLAFGTASLYFLLAAMNRDHDWVSFYIAGAIFLVAAILVRQIGIAIAMAFFLGDLVKHGVRAKVLLRGGSLIVASVVVLTAYPIVIEATTGLPVVYLARFDNLVLLVGSLLSFKLGAAEPLLHALFAGAMYTGLMTAPLALGLLVSRMHTRKLARTTVMLTVIGGALLLGTALALDTPIPILGTPGTVLSLGGVGPRNIGIADMPVPGPISPFWWFLTAVSSICGAFLLSDIATGLWALKRANLHAEIRAQLGSLVFFVTAAGASYLPFGLSYGPWFDRYILFSALPFLILAGILAPQWEMDIRRAVPPLAGLFAIGLMMATILTHDFFTWTRARWAIIAQAVADFHLEPNAIDGGFEYNNYALFGNSPPDALPETLAVAERRQFRIATQPAAGYDVIAKKKVGQVLPMDGDTIFLLRK